MKKIAILGYGNIGKAAEQALQNADDLSLQGVYHHEEAERLLALCRAGQVDAVLLCTPTRRIPEYAAAVLATGVCTVDSFDIHTRIADLRRDLSEVARRGRSAAVVAAGWDPGTDSVVRTMMQAMAPQGITYTDFGPGRSMGHTVAAKAIDGVEDALSMTIPIGTGMHRRMVYVKLREGADFERVKTLLLADDYFAHDETHVIAVDDVKPLNNTAHGVRLSRNGVSGSTHNQRFAFSMTINNPALTGQIMVSAARAALRLREEERFGAFTLIEIPPVYMLEGDDETNIRQMV